jgi:predicted naringenin-chalcone synthase
LDCEILHTELCTLHLDPASKPEPEQLVIQSLFSDGVIRYRASRHRPDVGYQILEFREHIVENSLNHMTWSVGPQGFKMSLSREIPLLIQKAIAKHVGAWSSLRPLYAIHPGGPRIIDSVKEALSLSEEQVYASREVLRLHGNMSSATLPHVWANILRNPAGPEHVVSMAFGPGLTLSASLMRRVG